MWKQRFQMAPERHPCTLLQRKATRTSPGCCWTGVWAGTGVMLLPPGHHAMAMCAGHDDPADTTVANVEAGTDSILTPLHCAAYRGHVEVARLLLARGMVVQRLHPHWVKTRIH
jgi:hypothetical protein